MPESALCYTCMKWLVPVECTSGHRPIWYLV